MAIEAVLVEIVSLCSDETVETARGIGHQAGERIVVALFEERFELVVVHRIEIDWPAARSRHGRLPGV